MLEADSLEESNERIGETFEGLAADDVVELFLEGVGAVAGGAAQP